MKLSFVLSTFFFLIEVEGSAKASEKALEKVYLDIAEDLATRSHMVSLVSDISVSDASKAAAGLASAGIPHIAVTWDETESKKCQLNSSAIVMLDSIASMLVFRKDTTFPDTFSTSQQLIIYCDDASAEDIRNTLTFRSVRPIIQNEYYLIEDGEAVLLLTFVWYRPQKCNSGQLIEVNRFDKSVGRWQHKQFMIDKFSNFHGCKLSFLIPGGMPEFMPVKFDHESETITECYGYVCAMLRDFSSALNYTNHMNMLHEGTTTWPDKPYHWKLNYCSLGQFSVYKKNWKEGANIISRPFRSIEYFMAIPPGEEYNGYEKLVLPFDEATWIWIGITFAAALITIFVLKFTGNEIAYFVIGKNTKTPCLNVLRAFFGISQITCPSRNFARYLLMLFIMFSLVVRTAYQGKMFEFLQKEMRKPTVTSTDEMIESNFDFYMPRDFARIYSHMEFTKRAKIVEWNYYQLFAAYYQVYIAGSKLGVFYNRELFANAIEFVGRTVHPLLLEDRIMIENIALMFPKLHFLYEEFNRKLQQYIEADLINYHVRTFLEDMTPEKLEKYKDPFAVLTLAELEAGFVVCMLPLILSIFVFAVEWLPTLKNLIVFLLIFEKYFELKKYDMIY